MLRIGFGYDTHPLVTHRPLILGGIEIPHPKGTLGHSDGDALIHAICDALFGALALGDIGQHFSDQSPEYKDIDSKILLKKTIKLIRSENWKIGNIDTTVCLEKPKINPHIDSMRTALANTMEISKDQISIKATTNEHMGFVGREEGVTAYAIVTVVRE
ncbi:MAG: 2-C-methyl-D-erythritol 2,4-cyclodiphosphate synthase [Bacteroidales bacterium]|nr:2-C-methyl-D-erythritol 2,4-cyclodiphosphate synthase [Bacteroidales bacterium]